MGLATVLAFVLLGCGSTAPPRPVDPSRSPSVDAVGTRAEPLYLALGDSLTAGYQGPSGDDKAKAYPAQVAAGEATRGRPLTLVNLACSGETTTSMVEGGRCFVSPESQLTRAERVLKASAGSVAAVTVWIGINDIDCLGSRDLGQACLTAAHATYAANLPVILGRLRAATGADVPIFVLTYYDPFRAADEKSPDGKLKTASAGAVGDLNATISSAAAAVNAQIVDTRGPIEDSDGKGLCRNTFVCDRGDIHLTEAGQGDITAVVRTAFDSDGAVPAS